MMKIIVFFLTVSLIFIGSLLQGDEAVKKSRKDGKHLEINTAIADEIEKKFNLDCCGVRAGGVDGLNIIGLSFYAKGVLSVDESRHQMLELINYYMDRLNSFEELEPYSLTFPFELNNIRMSLYYRDNEDNLVYYPKVGVCTFLEGKILYRFNDKENPYQYKKRIQETYEEAVEKVNKQNSQSEDFE